MGGEFCTCFSNLQNMPIYMETKKFCITRTTLPYNLLINSRISVVLRSDIALLWYYSHPTEIFFETILAIGVKPFGYSHKVFRLQAHGAKEYRKSLIQRRLTPHSMKGCPFSTDCNNGKGAFYVKQRVGCEQYQSSAIIIHRPTEFSLVTNRLEDRVGRVGRFFLFKLIESVGTGF